MARHLAFLRAEGGRGGGGAGEGGRGRRWDGGKGGMGLVTYFVEAATQATVKYHPSSIWVLNQVLTRHCHAVIDTRIGIRLAMRGH